MCEAVYEVCIFVQGRSYPDDMSLGGELKLIGDFPFEFLYICRVMSHLSGWECISYYVFKGE